MGLPFRSFSLSITSMEDGWGDEIVGGKFHLYILTKRTPTFVGKSKDAARS